ncbi:uncharacterized protein LOC122074437 [Macadamia integrifolia]|uniref:uncharacterized protein LOC122074437 n=1 Tax=Macadamia integrifolia TaxID=60698 RepID=UPI001C4FB28E|nr:uncharacterized protein LOC122074437 [Macadamia integrifolia]
MTKKNFSLCSFVVWTLWLARNELIFERDNWTPSDVICKAEAFFNDFNRAKSHEEVVDHPTATPPRQDQHLVWIPPPLDVVKINADASFVKDKSFGALGFIIHNHNGSPLLAALNPTPMHSIISGEAKAIKEGILEAIGLGYFRLWVESNNLEVITALSNDYNFIAFQIRPIIEDIRFICANPIKCSFSYVPMAINGIADTLARRGLSFRCKTVWPQSTPWLNQLCEADVLACNRSFF